MAITGPVGFVGLGNIGSPMARHVLGGGYPLVVYDLRPEAVARLAAAGAEAADSPRAVAQRCRHILLSLPTSAQVEAVCLGPDGIVHGAAPGTVVLDLTSGQPSATVRIAEALAERGIHMLDAPVAGGVVGAEEGSLAVMVGGDQALFEHYRPLLGTFGRHLLHMGPIGSGHLTKSLNNFLLAVGFLATAEATVVATKAGLDPARLLEVIQAGSGRNFSTERRFPMFVMKRDFSPRGGMTIELLHKDVQIATTAGREQSVPMPIAHLIQQLIAVGMAELGSGTPNQSLVKLYERWAGVEVGGAP
ncbi:MAG: NAD(P)-dependent oxidoreductase [Chloroflexi bacterium]|nr:NAD(P)-dependent oxidoreductase [Chloroflexota bacterium]